MSCPRLCGGFLLIALGALFGQGGERVLLVMNRADALSRRIADYYIAQRAIPRNNVCQLDIREDREEITWDQYIDEIERPVARCLTQAGLSEQILYIATTRGVPLKISGPGQGLGAEYAAVDSELTLLYGKMKGQKFARAGLVNNPFYRQKDQPFTHAQFPIYLVTRLAGYDFDDVKGMIDRSLAARNRGKFVFDLISGDDGAGNHWLRTAAMLLPGKRVVIDDTSKVLLNQKDVIGYAGWGSNDPHRHQWHLGFQWLPGALATEYVSTNGRTFARPPENWTIGTWKDPASWFAGAPQTLTADYLHDGVTGCAGHVYEPFLELTAHPDLLFPAYFKGRNLAESYYLAIPGLSWQNLVVGDPLCRLR